MARTFERQKHSREWEEALWDDDIPESPATVTAIRKARPPAIVTCPECGEEFPYFRRGKKGNVILGVQTLETHSILRHESSIFLGDLSPFPGDCP